MQAVANYSECQALLQKIDTEKSELCLSVENQTKLAGVLASFARAVQCCQRGSAWLEMLNVTSMWWNCARPIFNKVSLLKRSGCHLVVRGEAVLNPSSMRPVCHEQVATRLLVVRNPSEDIESTTLLQESDAVTFLATALQVA